MRPAGHLGQSASGADCAVAGWCCREQDNGSHKTERMAELESLTSDVKAKERAEGFLKDEEFQSDASKTRSDVAGNVSGAANRDDPCTTVLPSHHCMHFKCTPAFDKCALRCQEEV